MQCNTADTGALTPPPHLVDGSSGRDGIRTHQHRLAPLNKHCCLQHLRITYAGDACGQHRCGAVPQHRSTAAPENARHALPATRSAAAMS